MGTMKGTDMKTGILQKYMCKGRYIYLECLITVFFKFMMNEP